MNAQLIISFVVSLLAGFFGSNPTVQEVEAVLPQIMGALTSAKAGQGFGVSFPLSVDGVKGVASFSWTPTTAAPAAEG